MLSLTDTTDVQWASVEELTNSSLLLKCVFAEGSQAQGCQLTIKFSRYGRVSLVVELYRSNNCSEAVELYESEVAWGEHPSLVARDIEAHGGIADKGSVPGTVQLKFVTTRSCEYE